MFEISYWRKKNHIRKTMSYVKKAILLDRDETLNFDPGYINDPNIIQVKPGVIDGLRALGQYGFTFFVVTNQAGVAKGLITEDQMKAVNERLKELLKRGNVVIEKMYVCPHRDEDSCACRKPRPGLVNQAVAEYGIDTKSSFIIGDRMRDIMAGEQAGLRGILVYSREADLQPRPTNLVYTATDMVEAAGYIIRGCIGSVAATEDIGIDDNLYPSVA